MSDDTSTTTLDTAPVDDAPAPDGASDLGDAGKKALDAMKEREKAARARARELEQENARLKAAAEAKDKPAEDVALEAARREGETAAMARANERLLAAEVRAAAAGKLNDPTDALRLLDLSAFEVGADGAIDTEAVADAIADLIKSKPYLSVTPQRRPAEGSADGGTRKADASGPKQLTRADLAGMKPAQIEAARVAGQLADLMAGKTA
jgi:hypothetical protein